MFVRAAAQPCCRNGLQFFVWLEFGNEPIVKVFKKILCPVDMSKNSLLAVGLALVICRVDVCVAAFGSVVSRFGL